MRRVLAATLVMGCYAPTPPTGAPCPDGVCPSGLVCSPATRTCEVSSVDGRDAMADIMVDFAPPPTFLYRRRITITNASQSVLPAGFTIRVPLTQLSNWVQLGKARSDYADLRILGDGTIGERDRILDAPSGPAPVAVSFSLARSIDAGQTNSDYALYYGAPSAGAPPTNGNAVFTLFDDFTSGVSSAWLTNDGPSASGGQLVLRAAHTDALTTNAASDAIPIVSAVELIASIENPASEPTVQPTGTFWYWFGYQHTGDFTASEPWAVWIARGKNSIQSEQKSPLGCEMQCTGPTLSQDTAPHYFAIERDVGATRFYRDGALSATLSVTNTGDYSIMVRNFMATSAVRIDYVRARARVSPDPTTALGNEENL